MTNDTTSPDTLSDELVEKVRLARETAEYLPRVAEEAEENGWMQWGADIRGAAATIGTLLAALRSLPQAPATSEEQRIAVAKALRDVAMRNAAVEHGPGKTAPWEAWLEDADAVLSIPHPAEAELAKLRTKMRMIVSHATGGATSDIDLPTNEIAVRITRKVNIVWEAGIAKSEAQLVEARNAALEEAAVIADDLAEEWGKRWREGEKNDRLAGFSDGAATIVRCIRARKALAPPSPLTVGNQGDSHE